MKRAALAILFFAASIFAGDYWNAETGSATMKFLFLRVSPRSAALSGAGVASPQGPSELSRNPLAALAATEPEIGWNQIVFSDKVDADFFSVYYAWPYKSFVFSGGIEYLGYGDLEGRDEEGFEVGDYGASAFAAQLGFAWAPGLVHWAVNARFASQTIDDATAVAFLGDAAAGVRLNRYFAFAATFTNFGYVTSYESGHEVPPTALQAGVSWTLPSILSIFDLTLSSDLYRRSDSDIQGLFGAELAYKKILVLRAGYAIREDTEDGVSAGLGLRFGRINAEYAYATNPTLDGNHHISIGLRF